MIDIHEFGGCYLGEEGKPGANDKEILEILPRVIIPSNTDISKGWWLSDKKETEEMFKDRIKRVLNKLKDIAHSNDEDYTICLVTHTNFLNGFFSVIFNCELLVDSNKR